MVSRYPRCHHLHPSQRSCRRIRVHPSQLMVSEISSLQQHPLTKSRTSVASSFLRHALAAYNQKFQTTQVRSPLVCLLGAIGPLMFSRPWSGVRNMCYFNRRDKDRLRRRDNRFVSFPAIPYLEVPRGLLQSRLVRLLHRSMRLLRGLPRSGRNEKGTARPSQAH